MYDRRRIKRFYNNMPGFKPFKATLPPVAAAPYVHWNQSVDGGQAVSDAGSNRFAGSTLSKIGLTGAVGAGWVRLNFRLGSSFSSWTPQILDLYDTVVNAYVQSGITILGLICNEAWPGTQTDWTANNNEQTGGDGNNTYIQNLAAAAKVIATRFYPRVKTFEIWNEPDAWTSNPSDHIYTGGSFIYPSNFAQILKQCGAQIRSVATSGSDITIVSGGLFINDAGPIGDFPHVWYIPTLKTYGPQFDVAGGHIYINQNVSHTTSTANITTALNVIGELGSPIFITEVGWKTAGLITPAIQAANLQIAYQTFQQDSRVVHASWFNLVDFPGGEYGLYDASLNPKLSQTAYRQYANY